MEQNKTHPVLELLRAPFKKTAIYVVDLDRRLLVHHAPMKMNEHYISSNSQLM